MSLGPHPLFGSPVFEIQQIGSYGSGLFLPTNTKEGRGRKRNLIKCYIWTSLKTGVVYLNSWVSFKVGYAECGICEEKELENSPLHLWVTAGLTYTEIFIEGWWIHQSTIYSNGTWRGNFALDSALFVVGYARVERYSKSTPTEEGVSVVGWYLHLRVAGYCTLALKSSIYCISLFYLCKDSFVFASITAFTSTI